MNGVFIIPGKVERAPFGGEPARFVPSINHFRILRQAFRASQFALPDGVVFLSVPHFGLVEANTGRCGTQENLARFHFHDRRIFIDLNRGDRQVLKPQLCHLPFVVWLEGPEPRRRRLLRITANAELSVAKLGISAL